jgi:Carboxypeptidase regulatory-like domain
MLVLPSVAQDGTASLTGNVQDVLGTGIADTLAELESTRTPVILFQTVADAGGAYRFSGLSGGEYALKLSRLGFNSQTVKSIIILNGEHRTLPTLHLAAGANGDCRGHGEPDAIRFLRSGVNIGSLGGTVRLAEGLGEDIRRGHNLGVQHGQVLRCSQDRFGRAIPVQSSASRIFSVRVTASGFYPQDSPTYRVADGVESAYTSIYVERCPLGNCDPKLRPEKAAVVCE